MAPPRTMRTYSRGNNFNISAAEAVNILFAKNLTERKLKSKVGKKKPKAQIRELPKQIKSILSEHSSLHINVNDTFDKILKGPSSNNVKTKELSVKIIADNTSTSVIKHYSCSRIYSPIITKLRSYSSKSLSQTSHSESTNSWFKQKTLSCNHVSNNLEMEKANTITKAKNKKETNEMPISTNESSTGLPRFLRSQVKPQIAVTETSGIDSAKGNNKNSITEKPIYAKKNVADSINVDANFSFAPPFSSSYREKVVIHSSTPLVPNKSKPVIKQPFSPINTNIDKEIKECILNSLEEIKNWDNSFPNIGAWQVTQSKNNDSLESVQDFKGFSKKDKSVVKPALIENAVKETNETRSEMFTPIKKGDFITLRGRVVQRNFEELSDKSNNTLSNREKHSLSVGTVNLEDFECFFNNFKTKSLNQEDWKKLCSNLNTISCNLEDFEHFHSKISQQEPGNPKSIISLKDFENFCESYQTKMSSKVSFLGNRSYNYVTNRRPKLKDSLMLHKKFNLKELVVVLDNDLVNDATAKLKKQAKSVSCKDALFKSIMQKQPVVKLTGLSHSILKKFEPTFKAKDRLNTFKACKKFSSIHPAKISTKNIGSANMDMSNSKVSSKATSMRVRMTSNILEDLMKLFISWTQITLQKNRTNLNQSNKKNVSRSSSKNRIKSVHKCLDENSGLGDKSDKENSGSNRGSNIIPSHRKERVKRSFLKQNVNDNTGSKNSSTKNVRESRRRRSHTSRNKIYIDDSEELFTDSDMVGFKDRTDRKKQYIAKILPGSWSDTEICQERKTQFRTYSQIDIYDKMFNEKSASDVSSKSIDSSPGIIECHYNTSIEETEKKINSPFSDVYICRDLSNSILSSKSSSNTSLLTVENEAKIGKDSLKLKDLRVHLPFISLEKYLVPSHDTTHAGESKALNDSKPKTLNDNSRHLTVPKVNNKSDSSQKPKRSVRKKRSVKRSLEFSPSSRKTISTDDDDEVEIIDSSLPGNTLASLSAWKQKVLNMKTGKSWRRSLLSVQKQHADDVFIVLHSGDQSYAGLRSSVARQSKIVPVCDPRLSRRKSILQTYAFTNLNTHLDDSVQILEPCPFKPKNPLNESLPLVTAKEVVLKRCNQTKALAFEETYPESLLKDCKKIGEGVYGEVFFYSHPDGKSTVMKVIPIEGDKIINGERQKKFDEILSEIVISQELSNLRANSRNQTSAFCEVQRICCVKGKYPKYLLDLWDEFDTLKGSENDSPKMFEDDQLYIVLDLSNGGQDLEAYVFTSAVQTVAMFKQVACSLAVAEQKLQFEHRDLHWGNVLIRPAKRGTKLLCTHEGKSIVNQTHGVEVTIIDFTLSRISHDGVVMFSDLSKDDELFQGQGDYQFDIYRLMKQKNSNQWQKFEPYTNILWLHYILKKSISGLRYQNTKTRVHKSNIECLKKYEKVILYFNSVIDFVKSQF